MFAVFSWWLVVQLFALAALPLSWQLFARLPGRGYALVKAIGLLLVSYVLWLGASLRLLPNDAGGVVLALGAVLAGSAWLGRQAWRKDAEGHRPLLVWLREQRTLVLVTEVVFLTALAGWAFYRAHNPDIAYTEKPMEFAFINGILRSRFFPPQDPWLSGYAISYYYFGYIMLAALIRLTGVASEVGFNLGVAMWYALVMVSAFGVAYELIALAMRYHATAARRTVAPSAIAWALVAALFVGFLGNLEGIIDTGYQRGVLPRAWVDWIDIKGLTADPPTGGLTGNGWWWWRASRVIHDKDLQGNPVEVIDEFPLFSFMLGDMHPHVLGLPFALLAATLALNLALGAGGDRVDGAGPAPDRAGARIASRLTQRGARFWRALGEATGLGAPGLGLYAIALGGLAFLNTWDFPIYVGLAMLAFGVGMARQQGLAPRVAAYTVGAGIALAALGWVCYLPFYVGFQSQLGGVLPNLLFPSRFSQFFIMFGVFLVAAVFLLTLLTRDAGGKRVLRGFLVVLPWTVLLPVVVGGLAVIGMAVLPQGKAFVQEMLSRPELAAQVPDRSLRGLLALILRIRLATPWTHLILAGLIAWAAGLLWVGLGRGEEGRRSVGAEGDSPIAILPISPATDRPVHRLTGLPTPDLFALLLVGLALVLALAPEFVYLRDLFGTRMNTVFKFYYQAWAMLALAGAYALSRLAAARTGPVLKLAGLVLVGLLVLGGLWYPGLALHSKADGFRNAPTLDGLAYLRRTSPAEMAAIEWVREHVAPDAVVVEASGGSYSEAARLSMATGNPTLLGWDFHERQWRGNEGYDKLAGGRPEALDRIYRSARPDELLALLEQWDVDYVYIGPQERSKYGISDAAFARFDRTLKRVYDRDGVRIYAR